MFRRLALAVCLVFTLAACQPTVAATQRPSSTPVPIAQELEESADTLIYALLLLTEYYVGDVDPAQLMAAAQRGAWRALVGVGVAPQELELPPATVASQDSADVFRQRFKDLAQRYASKLAPTRMAHEMIRAAADSLDDCHTGFLTARQVDDQIQRMSGTTRFGGVGVILRRLRDTGDFSVVEVFAEGPAHKAGLHVGDQLVAVDGERLSGLGIERVVNLVRGPEGTVVRLGVARRGQGELELQIIRAAVTAPILRSEIMLSDIGYIRMYSFPEPLTAEIDRVLGEFERRNVSGVIVDLRDNSGGQLDVVTKVTSRFVSEGPLFQGVGQDGGRTVFQADGSYWRAAKPVVVLINSGTGSGGEIFAAAVKEHGRGRLVGTTTAGCVSTGQMFALPDGSAIEIATNRVLSGVRGSELNRIGVAADVEVAASAEEQGAERDRQLSRAVEILRGG